MDNQPPHSNLNMTAIAGILVVSISLLIGNFCMLRFLCQAESKDWRTPETCIQSSNTGPRDCTAVGVSDVCGDREKTEHSIFEAKFGHYKDDDGIWRVSRLPTRCGCQQKYWFSLGALPMRTRYNSRTSALLPKCERWISWKDDCVRDLSSKNQYNGNTPLLRLRC